MTNLSYLSKTRTLLALTIVLAAVSTVVSGLRGYFPFEALAVVAVSIAAFYFVQQTRDEIIRTTNVCKALSKGDFSMRVTHIREGGDLGDLQWSVNEMTDYSDAFIREATAAMEYVSRNQYFRRILEDGMHGSLLNGARIINKIGKSNRSIYRERNTKRPQKKREGAGRVYG